MVAAGATCEIKVTFTPPKPERETGDVTFTDNAAKQSAAGGADRNRQVP